MTALPALPPARPQPPIEPDRDLYTLLAVPADGNQRDVPDEPLEDPPSFGSPLDSLALALAELVDARATIRRVLDRLDDTRSVDPGPATVWHHLDRAHRLINAAADRLARHRCVVDTDALSASVTAAIDRGFSAIQASLESAGGFATAGGRTDSAEAPQPAGYWPGAVEVQP